MIHNASRMLICPTSKTPLSLTRYHRNPHISPIEKCLIFSPWRENSRESRLRYGHSFPSVSRHLVGSGASERGGEIAVHPASERVTTELKASCGLVIWFGMVDQILHSDSPVNTTTGLAQAATLVSKTPTRYGTRRLAVINRVHYLTALAVRSTSDQPE